ncbi:hypothetical protein CEP54_009969 [Fusarium duplospermum]|uniref:Peptidase M12A domain-containing protein n=1 Tax=Fusarium duplospermum TaxID=1325734 RepID=A0A428PMN1_9HYPO|nr:hypothetical protein CEP54_009969 [Fusarium duplospermum]
MPDAPMCGMAENRLLWPIEKHWLNVRFLNGSWSNREFVRTTVEAHFNSLPMGIKFYFYKEGETGKADIRIKFSNMSYSYAGTNAKLVRWSRKPTMLLDCEPPFRLSPLALRIGLQWHILHEFGHALGLFHEHQHPKCGRKWDITLLQHRTGWSRERVLRNYAPHSPEGKTLEPYDPKSVMHYVVQKGDDLLDKETSSINVVLSEGDKRILTLLYPPREEGMFKPPGDNSENNTPKKRKWWERLVKRGEKVT